MADLRDRGRDGFGRLASAFRRAAVAVRDGWPLPIEEELAAIDTAIDEMVGVMEDVGRAVGRAVVAPYSDPGFVVPQGRETNLTRVENPLHTLAERFVSQGFLRVESPWGETFVLRSRIRRPFIDVYYVSRDPDARPEEEESYLLINDSTWRPMLPLYYGEYGDLVKNRYQVALSILAAIYSFPGFATFTCGQAYYSDPSEQDLNTI